MKVTGFSFIRNAVKYDYPIVEAVRSVLPMCDNFVIAVGESEDETMDLIASIDPGKIKIIETQWDDSLREGGKVLAQETNKAFQAIDDDTDWAFYIQGDEVIHEKYYENILKAMERWKDDDRVDGLLFNYLHFYGSYDYVAASPKWYTHEIRIIKNDKSIYSHNDAQGFKKGNNQKLRVKPANAYVYHYGWVKEPAAMQRKQESFHKMWHDDQWMEKHIPKVKEFDYSKIDALKLFEGTHPAVMQERIKRKNWEFDFDPTFNRLSLRYKLKQFLRDKIGIDLGYKNYIKI